MLYHTVQHKYFTYYTIIVVVCGKNKHTQCVI